MSLLFGTNTSDRVDCGSQTSIDQLLNLTVLALVRPNTFTAGRVIVAKKYSATGSPGWRFNLNGTSGQVQFNRHYFSDATNYVSGDNLAGPVNTWRWLAMTFAELGATGAKVKFYGSDVHALLAETSSYSANTDAGSSSVTDVSENLKIANFNNAPAASFQGEIEQVMIFNAVLTLDELIALQFRMVRRANLVAWWRLNATPATQYDFSGNTNNGTITGATQGDGAPIPRLYGGSGRVVWADGTGVIPRLRRHYVTAPLALLADSEEAEVEDLETIWAIRNDEILYAPTITLLAPPVIL